jgi:hypothetical protein
MKNIFLKITFAIITIGLFLSCDEAETDIPTVFKYAFKKC